MPYCNNAVWLEDDCTNERSRECSRDMSGDHVTIELRVWSRSISRTILNYHYTWAMVKLYSCVVGTACVVLLFVEHFNSLIRLVVLLLLPLYLKV